MTSLAPPDASLLPSPAEPGDGGRAAVGVLGGAAAMVFVGGSVAVSAQIAAAPLSTLQSVRYAAAALVLLVLARLRGVVVASPRGVEWLWLGGVVGTGLVLFNVALVRGGAHAEPAVLGVAVACVPLVLAVVGPLAQGRRPSLPVLLGAAVVTVGAVVVEGVGRSDGVGLAWAGVVLLCEAGFTLLAVPVLGRLGPWGVSVHATWMAALAFAVLGVAGEGPGAVLTLTGTDLVATAYLAVAVTAVAFVLWYSCVGRIGPARAGLLTGVAPIAAAGVGMALGGPAPRPLVWAGVALVACGVAIGFTPRGRPADPSDVQNRVRDGGVVLD